MTKSLSIELIRTAFELKGWTLLSKSIVNRDTKVEFQCDRGHTHVTSWNSFRHGNGCGQCARNIRKTIEDVRESFSEIGWTLLSTEYNNAQEKLAFQCNNGHVHSISWGKFQNGKRCVYCSGLNSLSFEQVDKLFQDKGWKLVSNKYINADRKLIFICDNGHKHSISVEHLLQGNGCGQCAKRGFKMDKPATLYYIQFTNEGKKYYKIGVTNRTINKRFKRELDNAIIGFTELFILGSSAYKEEQEILKKYKKYRYKGEPFLRCGGNTELFIKDVLKIF